MSIIQLPGEIILEIFGHAKYNIHISGLYLSCRTYWNIWHKNEHKLNISRIKYVILGNEKHKLLIGPNNTSLLFIHDNINIPNMFSRYIEVTSAQPMDKIFKIAKHVYAVLDHLQYSMEGTLSWELKYQADGIEYGCNYRCNLSFTQINQLNKFYKIFVDRLLENDYNKLLIRIKMTPNSQVFEGM